MDEPGTHYSNGKKPVTKELYNSMKCIDTNP
jgi:hypothetical protein